MIAIGFDASPKKMRLEAVKKSGRPLEK